MTGNVQQRGRTEQWQLETYGALQPYKAGNSGASWTPDCANGETQIVTLNSACTINVPPNPPCMGSKLFLVLIQDATAGRAVTWAGFRDAPAIGGALATAGQRASCEFRWDGASWEFCGGASVFA